MRYYKLIDDGRISRIGTGIDGEEITEAEYNTLLTEIRSKADLVNKLYASEITIADVPADWQDDIQRRVDERIAADGEAKEQPISGDDLMSMMEAVL